MKQLIISFILLSIVYCKLDYDTINVCFAKSISEDSVSACKEINLGDWFSCIPVLISYLDNFEDYYCQSYPDDVNIQNIFLKLDNGFYKEYYSRKGEFENDLYFFSTESKDIIKEQNVIHLKEISLSNEEKSIFVNKKTCTYYMIGRVYDILSSASYEGNYEYIDIPNKDTCFNAEQFPELKGILNCGYAEIKYVIYGHEYNFKTCFFIPSDEMPKDIQKYFKIYNIDGLFKDTNDEYNMLDLFNNIYDDRRRVLSKSRKLDNDGSVTYEVIVEDKDGKKVKYSDSSDEIKIIKYGEKNYRTLFIVSLIIQVIIISFILINKYHF